MFYALDLGGTNFRVLRVQLLGTGGGIGKMEYEGASISPELMTGTTEVRDASLRHGLHTRWHSLQRHLGIHWALLTRMSHQLGLCNC